MDNLKTKDILSKDDNRHIKLLKNGDHFDKIKKLSLNASIIKLSDLVKHIKVYLKLNTKKDAFLKLFNISGLEYSQMDMDENNIAFYIVYGN